MAVLSMKKIDIVALQKDRKGLLEFLQICGVTEIIDIQSEGLVKIDTISSVNIFERNIEVANKANSILAKYSRRKQSLLSSFLEGNEIEQKAFDEKISKSNIILKICNDVIEASDKTEKCREEINSLETKYDAISIWKELDIPTDFKGSKYTRCIIGTVPGEKTTEYICSLFDSDMVYVEVINAFKDQTCFMVICHKDYFYEVEESLRKADFIRIENTFSVLPEEKLNEIDKQIREYEKTIEDNLSFIRNMADHLDDVEFLIDYYSIRRDKYNVLNKLGNTKHVFAITGYIPERDIEKCVNELNSKFTVAIATYDPDADEDVPVLLENNSFVAPVEPITEMYALPGKNDIDPSPFMAFFYYMFFGLMFSDAGYGVIMVILSAILLRKKNLKKESRKTFGMFLYCGISTVIWGAMFGSWFGDIVPVFYREFLHKEAPSLALWFEPVSAPIRFLVFAFALGIIHLFSGVVARGTMYVKEKKVVDAIFNTVPVMILVTGAAFPAAKILTPVPDTLVSMGKYMASAGIILVILNEIRMAANIFAGIGKGLYSIYGIASGYLSDILSYSRLLALGLATGSIAGVINIMGTLPESTIMKAIMLPIVFIIGHTANFMINALGAYVHSNRLMFVELFSKFYEGGGRAFKPFNIKSKYIKIREDY